MPLDVVNVLTTKRSSCLTYFAVVSFSTTRNSFTFGVFFVFVARPLFVLSFDVGGPSSGPIGVTFGVAGTGVGGGTVVAGVGMVDTGTGVDIGVGVAGAGSFAGSEVWSATGSKSINDLEAGLLDGPEVGVRSWTREGISTSALMLQTIKMCSLKTEPKAYSFRPDRGLVCTKVCLRWNCRIALKHTRLWISRRASPG